MNVRRKQEILRGNVLFVTLVKLHCRDLFSIMCRVVPSNSLHSLCVDTRVGYSQSGESGNTGILNTVSVTTKDMYSLL
jgi:hypothetical protein